VIGYQLLSGKLPYKVSPASIAESVRTIVQDDPMPLSGVDRSLRGDVSTIVGKALSKEKSRRYQSAAEMAADIRRFLRDEPITAHPPSTMYQLGKFARRNKGLVAGVAAAFVVLIAGVIGTSIGLVRAQRARAAADKSAQEALIEAKRQEAVNRFMQEMIAGASPRWLRADDRAKGRDVTLLEALRNAAKKVDEGGLRDQPIVELAVRITAGGAFADLGDYAEADRQFSSALPLARELKSEQDEAQCAVMLAFVRRAQGRPAEAEPMAREAVDLIRKAFGPEHERCVLGMTTLVQVLEDLGKLEEAEPLMRQVLALRQKISGPDHPDSAQAMANLALLLMQRGRLVEAESHLRKALAILETKVGKEHPDIASIMGTLAGALRAQGKTNEAIDLLQRSLQMRRKLFGDDHPDVAGAITALARAHQLNGNLAEAEMLSREAIAQQRKILGDIHPDLAISLNLLATLLREQKKYAEAEAAYKEALEIRQKALGEQHPAVGVGMANVAAMLREQGKLQEAERYAREGLRVCTARFGEAHGETAVHHANLGACLLAMQRFEEAEQEFLVAHRVFEAKLKPGDRRLLASFADLRSLYAAWGKPDRAAEFAAMLPATRPSTQPTAAR
jgi:tetratricopeptide (TPR) repeat protein